MVDFPYSPFAVRHSLLKEERMDNLSVGSIVRCRGREWVVLPSDSEILLLRPLTGGEEEVCGVHKRLMNLLPWERVEPAQFPLPKPEDAGDAVGAELLWNAARLTLRDGAGPFRSLGKISVRPRAYQLLPMLMALRLDPVRMLIADDVGVGKTIEALLIARELLDRGDIRRICILCPPYLCDQWQREMKEKFHLNAVVIRSGTVRGLERGLPSDQSVFGYYPFIVVSIDYAKSERHKANFILHCPELVIVDEVHGAAKPAGQSRAQQQRHELLCELAANPNRHLILLTATPHSGIEESFLSLLGLLKPEFSLLNLRRMEERERDELARHFIQRRRADVERWLDEETPFPKRESEEAEYILSPRYRELFERVYEFSRELVRTGETLTGWRRRIRFWAALSLLRCVMSSPAAAVAALEARIRRMEGEPIEEETSDELYASYIYEPTDEEITDTQPSQVIEESERELGESERRQLRRFAMLASKLMGTGEDRKIIKCAEVVSRLLQERYHPIVWCRYIPTSDYVAQELQRRLKDRFPDIRAISITGAMPEDERRIRVEELSRHTPRVLVATDCLSEGINLQEHFTAVIHYDLPWNPNKLEQREGRVDRFGQPSKKVKAILLYGKDNPVDGAVLDVLLRKAKEIYKTLGVSVPVPMDSETVMEAVLKALFLRVSEPRQLLLFDEVRGVHGEWDRSAQREKESRTRFAQRVMMREMGNVKRELEETDTVLGDPDAVRRFVLNACQRLGIPLTGRPDGTYTISLSEAELDRLPYQILQAVSEVRDRPLVFTTPAPEGAVYLGRNHPFVSSLARYLLESALSRGADAPASRCGVLRTQMVSRRTVLLLSRLRFMLDQPDRPSLLAEEVLVTGFRGFPPDRLEWLSDGEALRLIQDARPESNVPSSERREVLEEVLGWWDELQLELERTATERAKRLEDSHRRVRSATRMPRRGLKVQPKLPPDLLGILVLLPMPKGVVR